MALLTTAATKNNLQLHLPKGHPLAGLPVPCPLHRTFKNAKEFIVSAQISDGNTYMKLVQEKNAKNFIVSAEIADGNTYMKLVKEKKEDTEEKVHVEVIKKINNGDVNTFSCVCGGELVFARFNKRKTCSHCCKPINIQSKFYRCNNGKSSVHKMGFYICSECGENIKQLKKQYGQSVIKYNRTNNVNSTIKSATHWIWCLVGGRYGSKQLKDAASSKRFKKGMTQNLDLIEEYIQAKNFKKARKDEPMTDALYRRLFAPESLTKKQVLLTIEWLLSWCHKISSFNANSLCGAVIYYTGHGREKNGNWLLQEGDIRFEDIYDVIVNFRFLWQQLRLVFIIDCCYAGAWCKKLASMYDVYPSTKQIIIMASAEKTVSFTRNGGYFTRYVLGIDEELPKDAPVPYYCAYQSKTDVFTNKTNVLKWKDGYVAQQK